MRRVSLVLAIGIMVSLLAAGNMGTRAQETTPGPFATPGPGEFELTPGMIGRELASGQLADLPQPPAFVAIYRFTNAPGSVFTSPATDPGIALITVESGEATWRLESPATINRASGPEEVAAGTAFTLGPGEFFVWPGYVAGEFRNNGQEPAVTLVAFLAPVQGAAATPVTGTPEP